MSKKNQKIAIVVTGYYKQKDNEVYAIYLLDDKQQMIIPRDEAFGSEMETCDCLCDIVNKLKGINYKVVYDKKMKDFDVTKYFPQVRKAHEILPTQKLGDHQICLN
jgi:hypothetical protein